MDPLSHLKRKQKWKWDYLGKTSLGVSGSWADTVHDILTNNRQSINQKAIMFGIGTFCLFLLCTLGSREEKGVDY